ncbi:MAG: M4 family metallopeptidase, partial [Bacteroidia bacterium]|nr:M4 family metallopeptidase [Bacteroidia bacterium]
YYLNTHSRNSINGEGGSIISVINMPNEDGSSMGNAFWNGQAMFYGNGDASFFSLARALDVAGHEMTHGVTEKSAGLEYRDQSGAINESMSDVFGALIERNNFKIGEDVVRTSSFPSGALRDMSDPHNGGTGLSSPGWQPAHMSEFINTTQDNGGVHINSGIPNKAFFLFASSTTLDKAEDVYYRALTTYLTKNSQFIDLRIAVIQAATDLFGSGSGEVNAARSAFDAVGITSGSGGGGSTQTLAMNPGDSYILLTDAPIQTSTTLWATDSIQSFFLEISSTPLKSKPSVTDDGSMAYFVAADGTVHRVELTSPPVETIIDNSPIWHNVAVSKDGLRLALNTEGQDSSIVIVDLNSGNGVVYRLFNPTTAQGQVVENVIFADALEWDYSDQFVMYDAFSLLQNASGQDIDFWDVGFLEAWDSQANTFGSGNIEKLFSNLPEGISIGNPAFSKNSPNIIAFDMLDLSTGSATFAVLGSDLQSGEVGTIFNNNTIGWPNFSKSDNQVLFTSISSDTVIGIINLQPDKINAAGSASEFISLAKWPVWIAQGSRSLISVPELGNTIGEFTLYPNPAEDQLMILYNLKEAGSTSICLFDLSGNKVAYWNYHDVPGAVLHEVDLGEISQGIYTVQIRTGKAVARKLLVHTK